MRRMVRWVLPADIERADDALVEAIDAALRAGERRAGSHLACRLGCTECCIGVFDITALDAARLTRGVAALHLADPARSRRLVEQARARWELIAPEFPGDRGSGGLADDEARRAEHFARFADTPCPALDPRTGACVVYAWRPLTCRTFGLPVRFGAEVVPPCRLNFTGATVFDVEAATVDPDPDDAEGRLLGRLRDSGEPAADTVVAYVLARAGDALTPSRRAPRRRGGPR
ncbi:MAG: YkgJ family cysteine cluster protein [Acidobacteria bacterium]|nr:YkgJ family cysteine cluster protein [Acidobacteriota bacterium]